jgi:hypothetical protein
MITRTPRLFCVLLFSVGPFGCAEALAPEVASVVPRGQATSPIHGPFVAAGTLFSVEVDEPIDTYYSPEGSAFTATVVDPLFDSRGQLVVPYGAKLRGTIASVGTYELPKLRIALRSIDTVRGPTAIEAAVREAQHYQWAGPDPLTVDTSSAHTYTGRYGQIPTGEHSADLFGYQAEYGFGTTQPREVRIPKGAIMELSLVAPLAVP